MNRSIYYVTTVNVSDLSAQSLQIRAMSHAFNSVPNLDFKLYAFGSSKIDFGASFPTKLLTSKRSKTFRTIDIFLNIIFNKKTKYAIFTRDLYLALMFTLIGKKVIWEAHQQTTKSAKKLLRFLNLFGSFKVLTISDALKHSEEIPIFQKKIFSYHDGVSLDDSDFQENNHLTLPKENIALYTGALHKGDDIESLEPLFGKFTDWSFLFIGGKETDINQYQVLFSKYKNVTFMGRLPHKDIKKHQRSASVLLYPLTTSNKLWRYTSPLKLFEYMMSGNPIIGSNIGSVSEIINDSNAFIFKGKDGVTEAFQRYLDAPSSTILNQKKINAELIKNKFNWNKRVDFIISKVFE